MRYALIDKDSLLVYMIVDLTFVSAQLRDRWVVIASDTAQAGDKWGGATEFEPTWPRPHVNNSLRYTSAGYAAYFRNIDKLPASEQSAAILKGQR